MPVGATGATGLFGVGEGLLLAGADALELLLDELSASGNAPPFWLLDIALPVRAASAAGLPFPLPPPLPSTTAMVARMSAPIVAA